MDFSPKTVPWGTPLTTAHNSKKAMLQLLVKSRTCHVQSVRKSMTQLTISPLYANDYTCMIIDIIAKSIPKNKFGGLHRLE